MVLQLTRGNNILDVMLTNAPMAGKSTLVLSGVSDHAVVHCEFNLQYTKVASCARRWIYGYQKARKRDIQGYFKAHYDVFETLAKTENRHELRDIFEQKLLNLRDRYVLAWLTTLRRSRSKPWCAKEVRRLARKQATAYTVYWKMPTPHLSKRLELITKQMKSVVNIEKNAFFGAFKMRINEFLKIMTAGKIERQRCSVHSSTQTWQKSHHGDIEKATHLNKYFSCLSAGRSNVSAILAQSCASEEQMNEIVFDLRGIQNMLEKLGASKAECQDGLRSVYFLCVKIQYQTACLISFQSHWANIPCRMMRKLLMLCLCTSLARATSRRTGGRPHLHQL